MSWCDRCALLLPTPAEQCPSCDSALENDPPLIDGRYRIERPLGSGGMGEVYLATDLPLERSVAIKMLHLRGTQRIEVQKRFRREAALLASVQSEHVARVFAFGLHEDRSFFSMEYIRGTTLASLLTRSGDDHVALAPLRALTVHHQIGLGVAAVHSAGLVHCDIKPSNIVIEEGTGRPVLVDFGIAVRSGTIASEDEDISGTPNYMAPEQVIPGTPVTAAADVYALGCTLFETLTGRPPFRATNVAQLFSMHVHEAPPLLSSVDPRLKPVDSIVQRALQKDPSARFPNGRAFVHAIEAVTPAFETIVPAGHFDQTVPVAAVRALVIDDERMLTKIAVKAVETAFQGVTCMIDVAHSGTEALERWRFAPDLVILDMHMPGIDGIETLAQLRGRKRGMEMRALAWTARPDEDVVKRFQLLGVEKVLRKPLTFQQLVAEIKRIGEAVGWLPGTTLP